MEDPAAAEALRKELEANDMLLTEEGKPEASNRDGFTPDPVAEGSAPATEKAVVNTLNLGKK